MSQGTLITLSNRRQKKLTYIPERMAEFYPSLARTAANAVGKGGQYDHAKVLNQCKVAFQKNTVDKERARKSQLTVAPSKRRRIAEGFTTSDEDNEELREDYEMEMSLNPSHLEASLNSNV